MPDYSIGIDFGTSSCRALLLDLTSGEEVCSATAAYASGVGGVLTSDTNADLARQSPQDYLDTLRDAVTELVAGARAQDAAFGPEQVVAIGCATTASTPLPVDRAGRPLALDPRFSGRLAAQAWLWKDHTAHAEAARITEVVGAVRPEIINACGGTYSAEWFWAKILHCHREDPEVFDAAYSWVELCDFVTGVLTGVADPSLMPRSMVGAGHKAMYSRAWGGLPGEDVLVAIDPVLSPLRARLYESASPPWATAGGLDAGFAEQVGLRPGTPVAVGNFDSHAAGVAGGAGVGTLVKVMGTSTCDVSVLDAGSDQPMPDIPGMCGVVADVLVADRFAVEAGQSAVGDSFGWLTDRFLNGASSLGELSSRASALAPGEHGLVALDWFNGNRSVLVDQRLSGLIVGLTLHTEAHHVLRALVEATAFGARRIIEAIEASGTEISTVVAAGGLPTHSPWIVQVYADAMGRPIKVAASAQGSARGAAMCAAVAAGRFPDVESAQAALVRYHEPATEPRPGAAAIYDRIYAGYLALHDAFAAGGVLGGVMKSALAIRDATAGTSADTAIGVS